MNLVERAKNIVLAPKSEWPVIEAEQSSVQSIYMQYLVVLAAIPAVASFIGMSLIGVTVFGMTVRTPFLAGVVQMVFGYVLSLAMVYVVALIADALAPSFQGQKNLLNAFKLVAFSMTPGMLAGVFGIIPALGVLGLLASLYGVYLLYLGAQPLMKVAQDKALAYVVVVVLCAIVAGVIAGVVTAAVSGLAGAGGSLAGVNVGSGQSDVTLPSAVSINTPKGTVQIDTQKLDAVSQQLEALGKQAEEAEKRGDTAAGMQAAMQAMGVMAGAVSVQSAPASQ